MFHPTEILTINQKFKLISAIFAKYWKYKQSDLYLVWKKLPSSSRRIYCRNNDVDLLPDAKDFGEAFHFAIANTFISAFRVHCIFSAGNLTLDMDLNGFNFPEKAHFSSCQT